MQHINGESVSRTLVAHSKTKSSKMVADEINNHQADAD